MTVKVQYFGNVIIILRMVVHMLLLEYKGILRCCKLALEPQHCLYGYKSLCFRKVFHLCFMLKKQSFICKWQDWDQRKISSQHSSMKKLHSKRGEREKKECKEALYIMKGCEEHVL